MAGRLIVCPTPIGNLGDITPRVREALVSADYIACEDTRRTGKLLERIGIRPAPHLVSNHEGNETPRANELAQLIERGARVALVSDAGMPAISDPGYRLLRTCIDRNLEVEVLPGPSVVPVALVASGPANRSLALRGVPAEADRGDGAGPALDRNRDCLRVAAPAGRVARRARGDRPGPPRRGLPRDLQAPRGGVAGDAGRAGPPLPLRRQGRDRPGDRPGAGRRSTTTTSASRSTPFATWSPPGLAPAQPRASSPPSPAPAPTSSTAPSPVGRRGGRGRPTALYPEQPCRTTSPPRSTTSTPSRTSAMPTPAWRQTSSPATCASAARTSSS